MILSKTEKRGAVEKGYELAIFNINFFIFFVNS